MRPTTSDRPTGGDDERAGRWRRRAVNTSIAVWIVAIAVWNAPDSPLRRKALPPVRAVVRTAALDQNWGVFAPDPRDTSRYVGAEVTWSDGATTRWVPPDGGWLSAWRDYRWQKVGETIAVAERPRLEALAGWIATRRPRPGAVVTTVRVWMRTSLDPGVSGDRRGTWIDRDLIIWRPS